MSEFKSCDKCKYDSRGMEEYPCCKCTKNGADDFYAPKTNADRIRDMTDDELSVFLPKVKADYQWEEPDFPDVDDDWMEWLQSEADEERRETVE